MFISESVIGLRSFADFKEFLIVPADEEEAHKQKLKRLKLEYALGQKIEPILQVLKH